MGKKESDKGVESSSLYNIVNEGKITKKRTKKTYIPKSLKIAVWKKNIGMEVGMTLCSVCKTTSIHQMDFHCGHIKAESEGGETCLSNLVPVCGKCNLSMGRMNLHEFQASYFK